MSAEKSERQSPSETTTGALGRVFQMLIVMFVAVGGGSAVLKYLNREQFSHDKLTKVHYHGGWSLGEYQDCNSINLKEEHEAPELYCGGSSPMDAAKVFKVRFSGDLTYNKDKHDGTIHYWRCRHNGDADLIIICAVNQKK